MGGPLGQVLFLVVFIGIMYLLLIRPQKKREKAVNTMRNNLQVGDEVVTIGGICGKIVKTKDETLVIQVGADKIKFEVMRWAISKVMESTGKPTSKKARPEEEAEEAPKKVLPKRMKRADADVEAEAEASVEPPLEENEPEVIEVEAEIVEEEPVADETEAKGEKDERW